MSSSVNLPIPLTLKTTMPESWPAAKRLRLGWAATIQKRSCSLLKVWRQVRLAVSQTRMDLSSELDTISSCLGWKRTLETLL